MDFASYSPSRSYLDYSCSSLDVTDHVKYKRRYCKLKRLIKDMVFENAALCDQVSQLQEKIMIVKEERRFLLKKLHHFQAVAEMENHLQTSRMRAPGYSPPSSTLPEPVAVPKKPPAKKQKTTADILAEGLRMVPAKNSSRKSIAKQKKVVQPIALDIAGRPVFPITLGGLTVHSLGEVVTDRSAYHDEEYLFPVGFCSTRIYGNLKEPERKCVYTCKIVDCGSSPMFEIVADSDLDAPLVGSSASQCHAMLLHHINKAIGMEVVKTEGRGPEFFGFSHPTIHNLIQSSAGTRKCHGYRSSKFEVSRTIETADTTENDAVLNYDALLRSIAFSKQHLVGGIIIKEEPQDVSNSLRNLLMT